MSDSDSMKKETTNTTLGDNVVQLRFTTTPSNEGAADSELKAQDLINALEGLIDFSNSLASADAFNGEVPVVVVRPPEKGSFLIEAVYQWMVANPEGFASIALPTAAPFVVVFMQAALKQLRGVQVSNYTLQENGEVKLEWDDGTVDEVPAAVWKQLKSKKRKTKRAFRKLLSATADGNRQLEIRTGTETESTAEILDEAPVLLANQQDFWDAEEKTDDTKEWEETLTTTACIESLSFADPEKWRLSTVDETRTATIADKDFLRQVDAGLEIGKDSKFEVTIDEEYTRKNGRTTKRWTVTKVRVL